MCLESVRPVYLFLAIASAIEQIFFYSLFLSRSRVRHSSSKYDWSLPVVERVRGKWKTEWKRNSKSKRKEKSETGNSQLFASKSGTEADDLWGQAVAKLIIHFSAKPECHSVPKICLVICIGPHRTPYITLFSTVSSCFSFLRPLFPFSFSFSLSSRWSALVNSATCKRSWKVLSVPSSLALLIHSIDPLTWLTDGLFVHFSPLLSAFVMTLITHFPFCILPSLFLLHSPR